MEWVEPEFNERMETQKTGAAALLIGIGAYGEAVSALVSKVVAPRRLVPPTMVLATAGGWQQGVGTPQTAGEDGAWGDPQKWWQQHGDAGTNTIEAAIRAHSRMGDTGSDLDIILVADWQSAAGRALWLPVLNAARRAHLPFSERCFTLIFATDSAAFRRMTPEEWDEMRRAVDDLAHELERDAAYHGAAMRIGWCYLCDTQGGDTRALVAAPGHAARERELQREHIAEFIALLLGGLRAESTYAAHSLPGLRQLFRSAGGARVSTFGAGSFRLPVAEIAACAEAELAYRLAEHLHGAEGFTERPRARTARTEWEAASEFSRVSVRHYLEQGGGEGLLDFPMEPPQLEGVPDRELLALLDTWDAFLWSRWNLPDAPRTIVAARAARKAAENISTLRHGVGRVLDGELNGARVADYTLNEIEKKVMTLRATSERRAKHLPWLIALLATPTVEQRDERPDLGARRALAERALAGRLNRPAVWIRAAIAAATLFLFAWAAYQVFQRAAGLSGLLTRALGITSGGLLATAGVLDALLILLLCAGGTLFLAALQIGWSERRIQLSLHAYQEGIAEKYRRMLAALVTAGSEQVFDAVQAEIAALREIIVARRAEWDAVREHLAVRIQQHHDAATLATEEIWASPLVLRGLLPERNEESERRLAEAWLEHNGFAPKGAEATVATLARTAWEELAWWRRSLEWRKVRGKGGEHAPRLEKVVAGLRARVVVALPLEREKRSPVTHLSAQAASPNGSSAWVHLGESFIGLPMAKMEGAEVTPRVGEHLSHWSAPGQVAYVVTLHGLELRELAIWRAFSHTKDEPRSGSGTERDEHKPCAATREEEADDSNNSHDSNTDGHGRGGVDRDDALERSSARGSGTDGERERGGADEPGFTTGAARGAGTTVALIA